MKKVFELEINDDAVIKAVFNQYVGHTFPVMQMWYDNGKYFFTGYDVPLDESKLVDVTPTETYGSATFA